MTPDRARPRGLPDASCGSDRRTASTARRPGSRIRAAPAASPGTSPSAPGFAPSVRTISRMRVRSISPQATMNSSAAIAAIGRYAASGATSSSTSEQKAGGKHCRQRRFGAGVEVGAGAVERAGGRIAGGEGAGDVGQSLADELLVAVDALARSRATARALATASVRPITVSANAIGASMRQVSPEKSRQRQRRHGGRQRADRRDLRDAARVTARKRRCCRRSSPSACKGRAAARVGRPRRHQRDGADGRRSSGRSRWRAARTTSPH